MRVSKNDIFLNPEKYSGFKTYERLYVSENLSLFIRDFFTNDKDFKHAERLHKIVSDLGFKPMNLVLAGHDGMTALCQILEDEILVVLKRHYNQDESLLFSLEKKHPEKICGLSKKTEDAMVISLGFQSFLYFLLFIDVERRELKPKEKHNPKRYEPVKNDTNIIFTVADANWGFATDLNAPFSVSGHYRLQRYGPGRQHTRLIYIEAFEKHGYHRKAGKQNFLGE